MIQQSPIENLWFKVFHRETNTVVNFLNLTTENHIFLLFYLDNDVDNDEKHNEHPWGHPEAGFQNNLNTSWQTGPGAANILFTLRWGIIIWNITSLYLQQNIKTMLQVLI